MRQALRTSGALSVVLGLFGLFLSAVMAASFTYNLTPGNDVTITGCTTSLTAALPKVTCAAAPTPTPTPPPSVGGWHPPGAHDGLNYHEHGDQPPSWVTSSAWQPFTQSREAHTGYKGSLVTTAQNGAAVQLYLIAHIFSTEMARSHGDHDTQVWYRAPSGNVYYKEGLIEFSYPNILAPMIERTSDTGERPIALSQGDGGCETWYGFSRQGGATGLYFGAIGWVMCGRYQKFDGTITGGVGTFRSMDWVVQQSQLPAEIQPYATTEFGVTRLSWVQTSKQFPDGNVVPIN